MGILGRYIAIIWIRMFLLCLGSFVSIYLVLDMMDKVGRFVKAGGTASSISLFFLYKMPEMTGQSAPFSTLVATLLTLGVLSRNSEITAMRSCGVSLARTAAPILVLGLAASALMAVNAELVVPGSYERMAYIEKVKIRRQDMNTFFKRNNIWFRSENMIIHARLFEPETVTLMDVTVWNLTPSMNPVRRMQAKSASHTGGEWLLKDVDVKDFLDTGGYRNSRMDSLPLPLSLKMDDLRVLDNNADNLSFRKLREYAESLRKGGYEAYRYVTLMHAKIAGPFASFVMVMLGIPFSLTSSRSSGGIALGIGAGISLGFAYFVINAILFSYGKTGVLPPVIAAWGANILFVTAAVWLSMTRKE